MTECFDCGIEIESDEDKRFWEIGEVDEKGFREPYVLCENCYLKRTKKGEL